MRRGLRSWKGTFLSRGFDREKGGVFKQELAGCKLTNWWFVVVLVVVSILTFSSNVHGLGLNDIRSFFEVDITTFSGGVIWDLFRMLFVEAQSQGNSFFDDYVVNISDNLDIDSLSIANVSWDGISSYYPIGVGGWEIDPSGSLGSGLVGLWHLNNDSSAGENDTHVYDFALGINNGSVINAIVNSSGKFGGGFEFDGSGDYISIPDSSSLNLTDFTLSAWIYVKGSTEANNWEGIVGKGPNSTAVNYQLTLDYDGNDGTGNNPLIFFLYSVNSVISCITSAVFNGTGPFEGKWMHVVGTNNASECSIYINGTFIARDTSVGIPDVGPWPLEIGRDRQDSRHIFNGTIDEVAIWNRSLNSSEILELYQSSVGSFESNLIDTGGDFDSLTGNWTESSKGVNLEVSSDGSNWCGISNGETMTNPLCLGTNFTYRVNFSAQTNLDSVNISWSLSSSCVDGDLDGWNTTVGGGCGSVADCDDSNMDVYPDAPELCDGVDNQCPGDAGYGEIDEGCGVGITVVINTSRISGVAPLAVFFDATETTHSDSNIRPFHDLEYRWDFGDDPSAVWVTNGKSKNMATGGVAAHVFETPGNYTVNLTVSDGVSSQVYMETIMVGDPDIVYAGETYCYSASGDFIGCPSGATNVTDSDFTNAMITLFASNGSRRVLVKSGETFSFSAYTPGIVQGPFTIDAYGTGNMPLINMQGTLWVLDHVTDLRIMNINFTDQARIHIGFSNADSGYAGTGADILFLNTEQSEFSNAIQITNARVDRIFIVDSKFLNNDFYNIFYNGGMHIAFLGNRFNKMVAPNSHNVRTYITHSIISENVFTGINPSTHQLKFVGYFPIGHPSRTIPRATDTVEYNIISGNLFEDTGETTGPVWISPTDDSKDMRITDCIFEGNEIEAGISSGTLLVINAVNCTVRNNVFDGTGSAGGVAGIRISRRGVEPNATGNEVYHNTWYRGDTCTTNPGFIGVDVLGSAVDTTIKNNLLTAPNCPNAVVVNDVGVNTIKSNNSLINDLSYYENPSVGDFHLTSNAVGAIDQGTQVSVFEDFDGTSRPQGIGWDIGAFEFISPIPRYSSFNGSTTNFSNVANINEVQDAILEKTQFGMINFTGHMLDFTQLDLDRFVNISGRLTGIGVDNSGFGMNRLNVSARLVFYNVGSGLEDLRVYRDGELCNEPVCSNMIHNKTENKFYVDVSGFSVYTLEETFTITDTSIPTGGTSGRRGRTPECRDGVDNDGDGLKDYPNDPGCVSAQDTSELDIKECREKWVCDEWSECESVLGKPSGKGIQTRECYDYNDCGSELRKPELERECLEEPLEIKPSEEIGGIVEGEIRSKLFYFIIVLIGIVILVIIEEILRLRRRELIRRSHKQIYDLIKKAEDNIDDEKLAGSYYNGAKKRFERHYDKCDEKSKKYIKKELLDLYREIWRESRRNLRKDG